jgi:hypothetical protein
MNLIIHLKFSFVANKIGYNMVSFPARIHENSSTSIDNILIDNTRCSNYTVLPLWNILFDREDQLVTIDLSSILMREQQNLTYRKINKLTYAYLQNQLSYEYWDEVFGSNNLNLIFNSFLNTYLRIQLRFPNCK